MARPSIVYLVILLPSGSPPLIVGAFSSRDAAEAYCDRGNCPMDFSIMDIQVDAFVPRPDPPYTIRRTTAFEQMADALRDVAEKLEALQKKDQHP